MQLRGKNAGHKHLLARRGGGGGSVKDQKALQIYRKNKRISSQKLKRNECLLRMMSHGTACSHTIKTEICQFIPTPWRLE